MDSVTINRNSTELLEHLRQLIQSCIGGNRFSQNRLYDQFAPKMLSVCMRYGKNREEAEEIMQEGFVQVFKSLHNFKYVGSFEGWIRKIMMYCAIQHYRANPKMYLVVDIENVTEQQICKEDILSRLQKKELLEMVQALSPAYRIVFDLYVFEGMKHREIAQLLGISEGTSKSNFFDAKKILQKAIANRLKVAENY
ncbi:MAG: sigma-70 family RNA polymerase sigma factor [Ginsengibacter sp.]